MDLSPYQPWFVFAHVLGAFAFFAAHGVSMGVWWRLRTERDRTKLIGLLELSGSMFVAFSVAGLVLIIAGILAGIGKGWWFNGQWWLWVSIVLLVVIIGAMTPLVAIPMNNVRRGLGIQTQQDKKAGTVPEPVDDATLEALLTNRRPAIGASIAIVGIVLITWLMEMKPF
jgi:MFS family permease